FQTINNETNLIGSIRAEGYNVVDHVSNTVLTKLGSSSHVNWPPTCPASPSFSVLWNTGDTTLSIEVDTPGTYTFTVTDGASCNISDSFTIDSVLPMQTFYRDADSDGFGTEDDTIEACSPPSGYVSLAGDCND